MPTSIWTIAEQNARTAIHASLHERSATAPEEFWAFYRHWGPACVSEALDCLARSKQGQGDLVRFVRDAVARHLGTKVALAA